MGGSSQAVRRDLVLASLYVAQGTVFGFAGYVLIPTLSARGVSLQAQTGILALAGAPWLLKLLWAAVVDRWRRAGRRDPQPFAAVGLLGVAAALVVLATTDPTASDVAFVGVMWLLLNVMLALSDVATDALALDTVPDDERGRTQGFMLGGHHVGLEGVGGMALGAVVVATDLSLALWLQAALAIVVAGLVWTYRGGHRSAPDRGPDRQPPFWSMVLELARHARTRLGLVVAVVVLFADVLTSSASGHFWVQRLGWTPEQISQRLPPVLLGANVVGYLAAAAVVDRLGHARAAAWGSAALGLCWIGFGFAQPLWSVDAFIFGFVAVQAVVTALLYVGIHAAFMDLVDPRVRATHFVVFTVLLNVPRVVAPAVAAPAVEALDFAGLWVTCGVFQIAVAQLVRQLRPA